MRPELYSRLETYNIEGITESDKEELLQNFIDTDDYYVRHHTVLMLSELGYNKAVPFIIEKIFDKEITHRKGTLIWALEKLDAQDYFLDFIKMICEMVYEPRLWAFGSIEKYAPLISNDVKKQAIELLNKYAEQIGDIDDEHYKNSTQHFMDAVFDLLTK